MCDFPAMKLLTLRRFIAQDLPGNMALPLVTKIDEMRWKHIESTGCNCWEESRQSLNPVMPVNMHRRAGEAA